MTLQQLSLDYQKDKLSQTNTSTDVKMNLYQLNENC